MSQWSVSRSFPADYTGRRPRALGCPRIEPGQHLLADVIAPLETPVRFGVLGSALGPTENQPGFAVQAHEQFHQVARLHRQLERRAAVVLGPADIHHQAEVFGELQAALLGLGEVFLALQRVPEVSPTEPM